VLKYASFEILAAQYAPADCVERRLRIKTAHRAVFDYEPRPGFLYVRSRAISSRMNDNFDLFPAEEIEAGWRTFIGKPVFVNHHNSNHKRMRGVIIDAALHQDANLDGSPDTWVEVLMEVDAVKFPKLAEAIVKRKIERTSMGVDCASTQCTACENIARTPLEFCRHIPAMKGMRYTRKNATTGKDENIIIGERCMGLHFFENSLLVEDPADPTAYFLGVDDRGLQMTAMRLAADDDVRWERHLEESTCSSCGKPITYHAGSNKWNHTNSDDAAACPAARARPPESYDSVPGQRTASRTAAKGWYIVDDMTGETYMGPFSSEAEANAWMTSWEEDVLEEDDEGEVFEPFGDVDKKMFYGHPVVKRLGSRTAAPYKERQVAPVEVDTLKGGSCPVCGNDQGYTEGSVCAMCGYETPPEFVQDPDVDLAQQVDLHQDKAEDMGMDPQQGLGVDETEVDDGKFENAEESFEEGPLDPEAAAELEALTPEEQEALKALDPKAKPVDPETGEPLPTETDPEAEGLTPEQRHLQETVPGKVEGDPAEPTLPDGHAPSETKGRDEERAKFEHAPEESEDEAFLPGADKDGKPKDGSEPEEKSEGGQESESTDDEDVKIRVKEDDDEKRRKKKGSKMAPPTARRGEPSPALQVLAAQRDQIEHQAKVIREQGDLIERQAQQIGALHRHRKEMQRSTQRRFALMERVVTGLAHHVPGMDQQRWAALVKQADVENPAQPVPEPSGSAAPGGSTEQARQTDDELSSEQVQSPGASGATDVAPDAQNVDLQSPGAVIPLSTEPEGDVTTPVAGTQERAPLEQVRTEVDVKTKDNPDTRPAYPLEGGPFAEKPTLSSKQQEPEPERMMASMRLARLRIEAGLEQREDLVIAEEIRTSASSLPEINHEIETLTQVVKVHGTKASNEPIVREAVGTRSAPSFASVPVTPGAPSFGEDDTAIFE
jgi:hypothetical protein